MVLGVVLGMVLGMVLGWDVVKTERGPWRVNLCIDIQSVRIEVLAHSPVPRRRPQEYSKIAATKHNYQHAQPSALKNKSQNVFVTHTDFAVHISGLGNPRCDRLCMLPGPCGTQRDIIVQAAGAVREQNMHVEDHIHIRRIYFPQ